MTNFFQKHDKNPYEDLFWNLPETKKYSANVLGGSPQNSQSVIRTAEFLATHFPLETISVVLPNSLRSELPNLPNFAFLPSTPVGTFSGENLLETLNSADTNLLVGNLSKNSVTAKAFSDALTKVKKPTWITRDAIDLLTAKNPENLLLNDDLAFFASASQLQKLLRSVYYPKVMTLSQSLLQISEILHKFTLSYPVGLITLYNGQILVAKDGLVEATPLANSNFTPLTLWNGQFACFLLALNLYNPQKFLPASIASVFYSPNGI